MTCTLCCARAASPPESSRTGSGGASGSAKDGWFGRAKEKVKPWDQHWHHENIRWPLISGAPVRVR